jgi:hypothetical protein
METKQRHALLTQGKRLGYGKDTTHYKTLRTGAILDSQVLVGRVVATDYKTRYDARKELEGIWNTILSAEGLKKITGRK